MAEEIPYTKPYERKRQDHDTYRDDEEKEVETFRRKGKVMELVELDAAAAMNALYVEEDAEPVAEDEEEETDGDESE